MINERLPIRRSFTQSSVKESKTIDVAAWNQNVRMVSNGLGWIVVWNTKVWNLPTISIFYGMRVVPLLYIFFAMQAYLRNSNDMF